MLFTCLLLLFTRMCCCSVVLFKHCSSAQFSWSEGTLLADLQKALGWEASLIAFLHVRCRAGHLALPLKAGRMQLWWDNIRKGEEVCICVTAVGWDGGWAVIQKGCSSTFSVTTGRRGAIHRAGMCSPQRRGGRTVGRCSEPYSRAQPVQAGPWT